jgi:hypothetical protein
MSLEVLVLVWLLFEKFTRWKFAMNLQSRKFALKYLSVFDNINAMLPWKYINRSMFD